MKSLRLALIFLGLMAIAPALTLAQGTGNFTGKVIDAATNEPIPFSTLKLKNKMIGVVSNGEGDFQLPVSVRSVADTIEVTCIGYLTKIVRIADLSTTSLNMIALNTSQQRLSEVTIKGRRTKINPYEIVKQAVESIPKNFPNHAFSYIAYYRDYQMREKKYINLNEAIVEVFDRGFQTDDQRVTQTKLYEYKKNTDFPIDSAMEVPYDNTSKKFIPGAQLAALGGNELSILKVHDAVRNNNVYSYSFVNTLNQDFLKNHFFTLQADVYLNDLALYCISFESKIAVAGFDHRADGKIYIEKNNLAIHKIDYSCHEKSTKGSKLLYNIQVEYTRVNTSMYLNYISFNNFFKVRNETDFKTTDVVLDRTLNAFVVSFNNIPEKTSVLNRDNYDFKMKGVKLLIREIKIKNNSNKEAWIYLSDKERSRFDASADSVSADLTFDIKNIKDDHGRLLGEITFQEMNQFRELFVQKMMPVRDFPKNAIFIQKDVPLTQATLDPDHGEDGEYWMNSPLRKF
jgi:hypothetical protein